MADDFDKNPMAVVDNRLKVRGVSGLRVADCSIMPTLPSANTMAPAYMVGERAVELIVEERGAKSGQGKQGEQGKKDL